MSPFPVGIIGAYFGASVISFHTDQPNCFIGSIAIFVTVDFSSAAITASHNMASQKSCNRSCHIAFQPQLNKLHHSFLLFPAQIIHFTSSVKPHTLICEVQSFVSVSIHQSCEFFDKP